MIWLITAILVACGLGLLVSLLMSEKARKPFSVIVGLVGVMALLTAWGLASYQVASWVVGR